jgi:penicillin-binding protein 1C
VAVVALDTETSECLASVSLVGERVAENTVLSRIDRVGAVEIAPHPGPFPQGEREEDARVSSLTEQDPHPNPPPEYQGRGTRGFAAFVDLARRARSTGSTLKPLIYAAGFDAGVCSPRTMLMDSPAAWPGYVPANYDRTFRGTMTAAEALAESRNIPALVVLGRVGVEKAVGILDSFGLHTVARAKRAYGLSLAIGGAEATPMELAEAYATLGRGGVWKPVRLVQSEAAVEHRVMRAEPCWQALGAISGEERTAAVSPEAARLGVAWKTGTSSGHRDAWCAAVTRRRTVIVWMGNPDGEAAASLVGQEAAAPLALRLIANVDNGGEGWPAVEEKRPLILAGKAAPPLSGALAGTLAAPGAGKLMIVSPARGEKIVLSDDLAADRQQVLLEASSDGRGGIWWFVDDRVVGKERRIWWSPSVGVHRVRVVDGEGRSAGMEVRVERFE